MGNPFLNLKPEEGNDDNPFLGLGGQKLPAKEPKTDEPLILAPPQKRISAPAPGSFTRAIGSGGDFLNALWKSVGPNVKALYQEMIGDHEGAQQTIEDAERDFPTNPGFATSMGETIGGIAPTGLAIAATLAPEPVSTAAGAAVLSHYAMQGIGSGRQSVKRFEEETGEDVSDLKEGMVATGYGVTMFAAEYLGLKLFKGLGDKLAPRVLNSIGEAFMTGNAKTVAGMLFNVGKSQLKGAAIEGGEETLEQVITNAIDNIYSSKNITDGTLQALQQGAVGGAILGPFAVGVNALNSKKLLHSDKSDSEAIFGDIEKRKGIRISEVNIEETKSRLQGLKAARELDNTLSTEIKAGFNKLSTAQRGAIRSVDPKPDNITFVSEGSNGEANIETYTANILGNEFGFTVNRSEGETINEQYYNMYSNFADNSISDESRQVMVDRLVDSGVSRIDAKNIHDTLIQVYHGIPTEQTEARLVDSSIRNTDNELMKMYHGNANQFEFTDPSSVKDDAIYGEGIYFINNPEISNEYSQVIPSEENVIPVRTAYLNIKNPFIIEKRYTTEEVKSINSNIPVGSNGMTGRQVYNSLVRMQGVGKDKDKLSSAKEINKGALIAAGYDGILYTGDRGTDKAHSVVIAFNRGQIDTGIELTDVILNGVKNGQPRTPIMPGQDPTTTQIKLTLPKSKGGKRNNTSKVIPQVAEAKPPIILPEQVLETERRFNELDIDPKTWNKIVNSPAAENFKTKFREWWKVGLMDTGLLFSRSHGKAGGRLFQHAIEGYDKNLQLQKIGGVVVERAQIIASQIEAESGQVELNKIYKRVRRALENRAQAESILRNQKELELYETFQKGYDLYREELELAGIATVDDYFTRVARYESIVEDVFSNLSVLGEKVGQGQAAILNDAISGKVNSRFLKERIGKMKKIQDNPLEVFRIYSSSVSKSLAYRPFMRYFLNGFPEDIPQTNRLKSDFNTMHRELVNWVRGFISPEYIYGTQSRNFFVGRKNDVYRNLLMFNVRAALDNRTQRDFARAFTSKENWIIADKIFRKRSTLDVSTPRFHAAIQQASKDKAYLLDMTEADLGMSDAKVGAIRRSYTKLREIDPFDRAEQGNWDYSEILGIVEYARKNPEYESLIKQGATDVQAIEKLMEDKDFFKRSVISAQALAQQTQFMPGVVASPKFFRNKFTSILLMLKRFPVSQIENIFLSFNVSGAEGASALRILRRGFEEEVAPVEELQKIELFRQGIDSVVNLKKKNPDDVDVSLSDLNKFRSAIKEIENDLNADVQKIQPINKNNALSQTALWAKYSGKRVAYVFMWNYLANILADSIGIGLSEEEKERDPFERAVESAWLNLVPFFWEARNPDRLIAPALFPSFNQGFEVSGKSIFRGMLRWGFNITPFAGMVDRLSGRIISNTLTDALFPDKSKIKLARF